MRVNLIKLVVVVIDDQLGNVQDGLTLDSLSRRRFTDAEYEARVSSLNKSQRVPYEKIIEYTRAVLEYRSTGWGTESQCLTHSVYSSQEVLVQVRAM